MTRVRRLREADLPADPLCRMFVVAALAVQSHDAAIDRAEAAISAAEKARDDAIEAYAEADRFARLAEQSVAAYTAIEKGRELANAESRRHASLSDDVDHGEW